MEELEKQEVVRIEYTRPKFWHRVVANFVDIFIFVVLFISLFFASRGIVQSSSSYQAMTQRMTDIQLSSGIYEYSIPNKRTFDTIYYIENINIKGMYGKEYDLPWDYEEEPYGKNGMASRAISRFIHFAETNIKQERFDELVAHYDKIRLDTIYNNTYHYYFKDELGNIVINHEFADVSTNSKHYYEDIYKPMIEKYCIPCLTSNVSEYASILRSDFYYFVFAEVLPAHFFASLLTYFIPALFFRRGRMTLGKALYHIGLVDTRLLSPTWKRFTCRYLIFYFMEMVLSIFSFGIPFIVSFSMMAFSKRKQGFPDFILGLQEIDTSKNNIYLNYVEVELRNGLHGKAIDFKMPKPL